MTYFKTFLAFCLLIGLAVMALPAKASVISASPSTLTAGGSFNLNWTYNAPSNPADPTTCRVRQYNESTLAFVETPVECAGSITKSYSLPGTYSFHLRAYKGSPATKVFEEGIQVTLAPRPEATVVSVTVPPKVTIGERFNLDWFANVSPVSHICKLKLYNESVKGYQEEVIDCGKMSSRQISYTTAGNYNFTLFVQDRLGSAHTKMYEAIKSLAVQSAAPEPDPAPALTAPTQASPSRVFKVSWQTANVKTASHLCKLYYYKAGTAYVEEAVDCAGSKAFSYASTKAFNFALRVYDKTTGAKLAEATKSVTIVSTPVVPTPVITVPTTAVASQKFTVSWSATNVSTANHICKLYYYKAGTAYVEDLVECAGSKAFSYASIKTFNFALRIYDKTTGAKLAESAKSVAVVASGSDTEPQLTVTASASNAKVGESGTISWAMKNLSDYDCEKTGVYGVTGWTTSEVTQGGSVSVGYTIAGAKNFEIYCAKKVWGVTTKELRRLVTVTVVDDSVGQVQIKSGAGCISGECVCIGGKKVRCASPMRYDNTCPNINRPNYTTCGNVSLREKIMANLSESWQEALSLVNFSLFK